jgi:hypothetical protein
VNNTLIPKVRYEWLKELLPRLHVVDVHMLSSSGEVDRSIDEKPTVLTVSEQEQTAEGTGICCRRRCHLLITSS